MERRTAKLLGFTAAALLLGVLPLSCSENAAVGGDQADTGVAADLDAGSGGGTDGGTTAGTDAGGTGVDAGGCQLPMLDCAGNCIDPRSNRNHCGNCQTACQGTGGFPGTCYQSTCVSACPATMNSCNGTCVDFLADPLNCGGCGNNCGGGSCVNGTCTCLSGFDKCGGTTCVDLQTSRNHCGTCQTSCQGGAICTAGTCGCPSGSVDCNGTCTFLAADPRHCGLTCGAQAQCTADQSCINGGCACRVGLTTCTGGSCVDTLTDNNNCGGCAGAGGAVCTGNQVCANGTCVTPPNGADCPANLGLSFCDPVCTNLNSDPFNCGQCGNTCRSSEVCAKPAQGRADCRAARVASDCSQCQAGNSCCPAPTAGYKLCVDGPSCPL